MINGGQAVGSCNGKPAISSVINKDKFQDDSVLIIPILGVIQKLQDIDKNYLEKR